MRAKRWQRCVLVGLALAGGAISWAGEGAHAQSNSHKPAEMPDARHAIQADLRIRQMQVGSDGRALGVASPGLVLHLDRRQTEGRWKLALTMTELDRPTVSTPRGKSVLENPFVVSRLEYDEDEGGEPQLYDRSGHRVAVANDAQRRALGLSKSLRKTDWDVDVISGRVGRPAAPGGGRVAAGLFADAGQREARRQGFERQYGRPTTQVRGLDRYVSGGPGNSQEVLVQPDAALAVEINVLAEGKLKSRTELTYDTHPAVGYVRKRLRSEQALADAGGTRLVTDVEMANMKVDGEGR